MYLMAFEMGRGKREGGREKGEAAAPNKGCEVLPFSLLPSHFTTDHSFSLKRKSPTLR
jgi:hypothetical protein